MNYRCQPHMPIIKRKIVCTQISLQPTYCYNLVALSHLVALTHSRAFTCWDEKHWYIKTIELLVNSLNVLQNTINQNANYRKHICIFLIEHPSFTECRANKEKQQIGSIINRLVRKFWYTNLCLTICNKTIIWTFYNIDI